MKFKLFIGVCIASLCCWLAAQPYPFTTQGGPYSIGTYKQNGLVASVASAIVYTNSSGGYQDLVLTGTYAVITASTVGALTTAFTWTNENGSQTFTPLSAISTGVKSSGTYSVALTVSNTTAVTLTTILVNTTGAATYNIRAGVIQW